MKTISIMELRKNVYAATKELPVMVTAKGKTLFYIVEEMPTVQFKSGTMPVENKKVKWKVIPGNVELEERLAIEPTKIIDWCQLHFEKGVTYELKLITWEDENGTPIIDKKLACPKCIEKYQKMGRGRVYFL